MTDQEATAPTRRSVLRGTVALLGAGTGLAGVGAARDGPYDGFVCGSDPTEGETFTVESRCDNGDGDCEVIRATGLAPECTDGREDIYVDLHGTDPTIWVTPTDGRVGSIRPGPYRVVATERCGGAAPPCEGEELFRVRFRSERENPAD